MTAMSRRRFLTLSGAGGASRAVQEKAGGNTGWVWNIGMPDRMTAQVDAMAQAAGFAGGGEGTSEKDKLVVPGANSWIDDVARARWTAGASAYYFDGPWCPGVALKDAFANWKPGANYTKQMYAQR